MTEKVLVPVDLGHEETWKHVLPKAVEMVKNTGGTLVILTVVPDIIAGLDWRYTIRGERGGSEELDTKKLVENAVEHLRDVVEPYVVKEADEEVEVEVELIARYGTVYMEILDVAVELGITQIVMSAHRASMAGYLIGSNTARVVRHATCSVMVIR